MKPAHLVAMMVALCAGSRAFAGSTPCESECEVKGDKCDDRAGKAAAEAAQSGRFSDSELHDRFDDCTDAMNACKEACVTGDDSAAKKAAAAAQSGIDEMHRDNADARKERDDREAADHAEMMNSIRGSLNQLAAPRPVFVPPGPKNRATAKTPPADHGSTAMVQPPAPAPDDGKARRERENQRRQTQASAYSNCLAGMARETIPERGDGFGPALSHLAAAHAIAANCGGRWPGCAARVKAEVQNGLDDWARRVDQTFDMWTKVPARFESTRPACQDLNAQAIREVYDWCWGIGGSKENCVSHTDEARRTLECVSKVYRWAYQAQAQADYLEYKRDFEAKCKAQSERTP